MCESTDISDKGIPLPYTQGAFTVYQEKDDENDNRIKIRDLSTDRISLSITTTEESQEIFTSDKCEIKSIRISNFFRDVLTSSEF